MTLRANREEFLGATLPLRLLSDAQEWIPDLVPRPDGISFARGVLLGVTLCLPIWALVCWALVIH